jgi:hypothetical protein
MNTATIGFGAGRTDSQRRCGARHRRLMVLSLPVWLLTISDRTPIVLSQSKRPPATKDSRPWYTVRVQSLQCCDNDGGRLCPISVEEVQTQVAVANRIYAKARVRFTWSPTRDSAVLRNTVINSLMPRTADTPKDQRARGAGTFDEGIRECRKIAARYPGKMLVLFRWGDHIRNPTGNGYSGGEASWVVMPSQRATDGGIGNLAHEAGHYFGLGHTFARQFDSVAKASQFLEDHGGDTTVFDGDGMSDTLPDPGLHNPANIGARSVTLNGKVVPLPVGNIMSYMHWDGTEWMSNQQGEQVRAHYRFRSRFNMVYPNNSNAPSPIEAESISFETRGDLSAQPQRMERFGTVCWSGDEQVWANGRPGGSLVLMFAVKEPGPRDVNVYMTYAEDYGKVDISLDERRVGQTFDGFAPKVATSGPIFLGRHDLSRGAHTIEFTLVGKNEESKGTGMGVDCVSFGAFNSHVAAKSQVAVGKDERNGWVSLFNGRNLTGWKTHPEDHARWDVRNGILIGSGPDVGHLFSKRDDFKNFHFRVEAKISDGGNGGQYVRTRFGKSYPDGYEAQINSTGLDPVKTGSLFNLAPIKEMLVQPDEWFTQEVIADGNHIIILVNGNKVVDYVDRAGSYTTGHLALQHSMRSQDKDTVVQFRRIEVRELPDVRP